MSQHQKHIVLILIWPGKCPDKNNTWCLTKIRAEDLSKSDEKSSKDLPQHLTDPKESPGMVFVNKNTLCVSIIKTMANVTSCFSPDMSVSPFECSLFWHTSLRCQELLSPTVYHYRRAAWMRCQGVHVHCLINLYSVGVSLLWQRLNRACDPDNYSLT